MNDLNPIGSEKLQGDEKLKRILELTYFNEVKRDNNISPKPEFVTESTNGVYGIVKEKDGYYVKRGLNENSLDYIGGLFMKNKNRFKSYAEAFKRLELLHGQESLQEATRYVLKTKKTTPPAPSMNTSQSDSLDLPPANDAEQTTPSDNMGDESQMPPADDMGDESTMNDNGMEDDNIEDNGLKGVQRLTGKLGQKLRDAAEEMESDDIKSVINSVLSALDLNKLEDEDKDEILSNFDEEDDNNDFTGGENELPDDLGNEENDLNELDFDTNDEFSDNEVPQDDNENSVDFSEFDLDEEGNFFDDNNIEFEKEQLEEFDNVEEDNDVREFDLDELTNIVNKAVKDNLGNYFK